jgi:hypothetical protein
LAVTAEAVTGTAVIDAARTDAAPTATIRNLDFTTIPLV